MSNITMDNIRRLHAAMVLLFDKLERNDRYVGIKRNMGEHWLVVDVRDTIEDTRRARHAFQTAGMTVTSCARIERIDWRGDKFTRYWWSLKQRTYEGADNLLGGG